MVHIASRLCWMPGRSCAPLPEGPRGFQGIPQRDIRFTTTFVRSYAQEFEKLDQLRQQVEAGTVTLRVAEVYPPERAADAHRRLEAGGTRGRLVIQFQSGQTCR